MNYARNYKNLLNFVKVMPKILVVPFFSGHGVDSIGHVFVADCMPIPIMLGVVSCANWQKSRKYRKIRVTWI